MRHFLLALGWLVLTVAGFAVIAQYALAAARETFVSEAETLHRLLSQQVRQHEGLLDKLVAAQAASATNGTDLSVNPEQGLSTANPAVHRLLKHDEESPWPAPLANVLDDAQRMSLAADRVVAADVPAAGTSLWLVRGAQPTSFAVELNLRRLAKDALENPFSSRSSVSAWLEQADRRKLVLTAQTTGDSGQGWQYQYREPLNSQAMNVTLVAQRYMDPLSLPWLALAAWFVVTTFAALALSAWWQERVERARLEAERLELTAWGIERASRYATRQPPPQTIQRPAARSRVDVEIEATESVMSPLNVTLRELDAESPDMAVARGAIDQAARQSRRSSEMIAELQRGAEQPPKTTRLQPMLWDETLQDALELMEPHCTRLGIVTTMVSDDDAAYVLADPVVLEQVTNRLLDQALRALAAVPEGQRRLQVSLAAQHERAILTIRDTGTEPDLDADLPAVEGQRQGASDPRAMGLKRCTQQLVGMGGRLSIDAVAPRGAVVRVSLPRVRR